MPEPETDPDYAPPVPAANIDTEASLEIVEPENNNPFATTNTEETVKVLVGAEEAPPLPEVRRILAPQDELPISDSVNNLDLEE